MIKTIESFLLEFCLYIHPWSVGMMHWLSFSLFFVFMEFMCSQLLYIAHLPWHKRVTHTARLLIYKPKSCPIKELHLCLITMHLLLFSYVGTNEKQPFGTLFACQPQWNLCQSYLIPWICPLMKIPLHHLATYLW